MDSHAAACTLTMQTDRLRDRRGGGEQHNAIVRAALQVRLTAREQTNSKRRRSLSPLTASMRTHDLDLDARRALTITQIKTISRWRHRKESIDLATAWAQAVHCTLRTAELDSPLRDKPTKSRNSSTSKNPSCSSSSASAPSPPRSSSPPGPIPAACAGSADGAVPEWR